MCRVAVVGLSNAGVYFGVSLCRGRFDCGVVLQAKEERNTIVAHGLLRRKR